MTTENKKLIAKLTAIAILVGGISYDTAATKKSLKVNDSLENVVRVFNEDTKLDEVAKDNIATYDETSIIQAADKLETYIDTVEKLESYNFEDIKELDKLSKEEYEFADNLTKEDIILLMQIVDTNNDSLKSQEARIKAMKMLDFVNKKEKKWIKDNGKEITLELLSWAVKSSIGEYLGLPADEVENIEIPPAKKISDMKFYVIYDDQRYNISSSKANIYDSLYYYYQINSVENPEQYDKDIYKEAINSAKITTMTGINEENYSLQNERNLKEAKKVLKK